jgi:hypothetical protein
MRKVVLLLTMVGLSTVLVASPCSKNKAPGTKCAKTEQVANADGNGQLPACCKAKAEQGISCCKNKQSADGPSCSQKKWWQFWKKDCNKKTSCNKE